jgi:hypothetical protein
MPSKSGYRPESKLLDGSRSSSSTFASSPWQTGSLTRGSGGRTGVAGGRGGGGPGRSAVDVTYDGKHLH